MNKLHDRDLPAELGGLPDDGELRATWRLLGRRSLGSPPAEETDRAWSALAGRLGLDAEDPTSARGGDRMPGTRVFFRAAAMVLLAVGVTAAWYLVPVRHMAAPGDRVAVVLPDGSSVELNSGSSLTYRRGFAWLPGVASGSRKVTLSGEAFFDVVSGVRPFRVEAGPVDVRVLGTRFNVRAREGEADREARVEVVEGRVEVWPVDGYSSVILSAGELAVVRSGNGESVMTRAELEPVRIAAWRTGGLTLVDEPLSMVLAELSLRYGVRITLTDPARGTPRLSVYYPELGPLESVLSDLAIQQDLQYRRTSDGWELF